MGMQRRGVGRWVNGDHVVRHDLLSSVEPKRGELRQDLAFIRNGGAQNAVIGGYPVGGSASIATMSK